MIHTVAVAGYRSLRDLALELGSLTLITGANGTGKTSLYRALALLAKLGSGQVVRSLATEGGLQSALWAGPEAGGGSEGTIRKNPIALKLGYSATDMSYAAELGIPVDGASRFMLDPHIKAETIWATPTLRPATTLATRRGPAIFLHEGGHVGTHLAPHESMLTEYVDPHNAPEIFAVRRALGSWRFYDQLRTDTQAPARQRQVGTRSPVLAADGHNLAAALATIEDAGHRDLLTWHVEQAFGGSRLQIVADRGWFDLQLHQPGLLRPLSIAELSDGTLRYLQLLAALLSPQLPQLLVLNEPEAHLHPQLLPTLAQLLLSAAARTQVLVVTHSAHLAQHVSQASEASSSAIETTLKSYELIRSSGETVVAGRQGPLDQPPWRWPKR